MSLATQNIEMKYFTNLSFPFPLDETHLAQIKIFFKRRRHQQPHWWAWPLLLKGSCYYGYLRESKADHTSHLMMMMITMTTSITGGGVRNLPNTEKGYIYLCCRACFFFCLDSTVCRLAGLSIFPWATLLMQWRLIINVVHQQVEHREQTPR